MSSALFCKHFLKILLTTDACSYCHVYFIGCFRDYFNLIKHFFIIKISAVINAIASTVQRFSISKKFLLIFFLFYELQLIYEQSTSHDFLYRIFATNYI